uniref:Putative secreted protein n=1 Tax=Anopheles marajoara TaxID=58244 RepID=A0A2M4C729_9DIPT
MRLVVAVAGTGAGSSQETSFLRTHTHTHTTQHYTPLHFPFFRFDPGSAGYEANRFARRNDRASRHRSRFPASVHGAKRPKAEGRLLGLHIGTRDLPADGARARRPQTSSSSGTPRGDGTGWVLLR